MTGEFHVDFIDDDLQHDFVTTNRDGLVWDRDELSELQGWLFDKIRQVANEWKQKRRDKRNDELKKNSGHDYQEWLDTLGAHDKKIAKKIVDIVLDSDAIDTDKAVSLIEYVQSSFEFESFKNFADDLESAGLDETKLLALLKEWQMIEAKEFYRLSMGRIKAIDKLDEYMRNNAKEVPTLHNFIKSFPWLLDPRMMEFKDEVTYSNLLKEKYKDDKQRLNMELANLYKSEGVNPLAGCLPLLIQMPILMGMYYALYNFTYPTPESAAFLWLPNMSDPDPYYILPVLSALTTFLQQKMTTTEMNQQMKIMMTVMPIFIGWISLTFPSGLVLYWVTMNVVQIAQQWWMYRGEGTKKEAA